MKANHVRAAARGLCCWLVAAAGAGWAHGQSFADACADAPDVGLGTYGFDLTGATGDPVLEVACAEGRDATIDQWIRYVPASSGPIAITTVGLTSGDTVLSVHQDATCDFGAWTAFACNDDSGGPQSRMQIQVVAGEAILIRIAGALGSRPTGSVTISALPVLEQGDVCADPALAVLGTNTFDSSRAVDNNWWACRGFRDQWFSFTPAVSGAMTVSACGPGASTEISVWAGCDAAVMACQEYGECAAYTAVEAGVPVIIRVASDGAIGPQQFSIAVTPGAFPSNDNCETPAIATLGENVFDNTFATTDGFGDCPGGSISPFTAGLDVWFEFVPGATGIYDISTELSLGLSDTALGVYAECGTNPLACNGDDRGFLSFIRMPLTQGQTYLIRVSGAGLPLAGTPFDRGEGILSIVQSIPPDNDECTGATEVVDGVWPYNLYDASAGPQEPSCLPIEMVSTKDVWFRYVPSATGPFEASLLPGGTGGSLSAFGSCNEAALATAGLFYEAGSYSYRLIVEGQAGVPVLFRVATLKYPNDPELPYGDGEISFGPLTTVIPVNDTCSAALAIGQGVTPVDLTGSIKDCATDPSPQWDSNAAATDNDIYYTFASPVSGTVTIKVEDGVSYPYVDGLVVSVYDECGGQPIASGFEFSDAPKDQIEFEAVAGVQYTIRVGSVLNSGSLNVLTGSLDVRGPCAADVNGSGEVDLLDFFTFLNCFDQSLPCSDVTGEGEVDLEDYFAFFNAFDQNC